MRARARARGSYYMGVAMKLLYGRMNLHRIVRGLGPGLSTNPRFITNPVIDLVSCFIQNVASAACPFFNRVSSPPGTICCVIIYLFTVVL